MDVLAIGGLTLGILAIVGGNWMEGGHISSLMQPSAFIIVFGGTIGAILLQTPMRVFLLALKRFKWVFLPPTQSKPQVIEKIVSWSQIARREGLLSLQNASENEGELFAKKGLQMLADGNEPETIRNALEVELSTKEVQDTEAAGVYEGCGGYSPTIGIIGAVMGLIHVMNNLADPSALGAGIAVAFVATIYGVAMANLIFLPIAAKLKLIVADMTQYREMIIDGIILIAEGENPRNIESKLQGYLS